MPTFSNATCRNEESLLHEVQYCNYRGGEEDELRGVHGPIAAPSNSPGQAPHCIPPSPLWQFMTDREGLFTPRVQATYTLSRGIRSIFHKALFPHNSLSTYESCPSESCPLCAHASGCTILRVPPLGHVGTFALLVQNSKIPQFESLS